MQLNKAIVLGVCLRIKQMAEWENACQEGALLCVFSHTVSIEELQWGLIKPRSVGSRDQNCSLNGPRIRFHPTHEPFCQNTPIIAHVVYAISVIFKGLPAQTSLETYIP